MSIEAHICPNEKCGYLLPEQVGGAAVAVARCPVCATSVRVGARSATLVDEEAPTELEAYGAPVRRVAGGSYGW